MTSAEAGEHRPLGELLPGRLGHAEVDHLRHRLAVVLRDEHVRRLKIAMDDPLLMRVLHRVTDVHEQFEPILRREAVLVAVLRDRDALDQLHHEVRPAAIRRAGIEHARNIRMIHHRQRLPLRLEAGDHLP